MKSPCQNCGGRIEFDSPYAGKSVACPHCQQTTVLPRRGLSPLKWVMGAAILFALISLGAKSILDRRKPMEREIRGSVFVVTSGAGTIPLSDVEIILMRKTDMVKWLDARTVAIAEALTKASESVSNCEASVAAATRQAAEAKATADEIRSDFPGFLHQPRAAALGSDKIAYDEGLLALTNTIRSKFTKLSGDVSLINASASRSLTYYNNLSGNGSSPGRPRHFSGGNMYGEKKIPLQAELSFAGQLLAAIQSAIDSLGARQSLEIVLADALPPLSGKGQFDAVLNQDKAEFQRLYKEASDTIDGLIAIRSRLTDGAKNAQAESEARLQLAQEKLSEQNERMRRIPSYSDYFSGFSPVTISATRSDVAGKFTIRFTNTEPLTAFAYASRETLKVTESYYWMVDVPSDKTSVELDLSNSRMVTADPCGYFRIKPKE